MRFVKAGGVLSKAEYWLRNLELRDKHSAELLFDVTGELRTETSDFVFVMKAGRIRTSCSQRIRLALDRRPRPR